MTVDSLSKLIETLDHLRVREDVTRASPSSIFAAIDTLSDGTDSGFLVQEGWDTSATLLNSSLHKTIYKNVSKAKKTLTNAFLTFKEYSTSIKRSTKYVQSASPILERVTVGIVLGAALSFFGVYKATQASEQASNTQNSDEVKNRKRRDACIYGAIAVIGVLLSAASAWKTYSIANKAFNFTLGYCADYSFEDVLRK